MTFTMAKPCLAQIAWLAVRGDGFEALKQNYNASKATGEPQPVLMEGFELPPDNIHKKEGWRGEGLGTFMLICVIKQLVYLKEFKKDKLKKGPEIFLQCTTVDTDACSFYIKQGFRPFVPKEVHDGDFVDMSNIGKYQRLDLNC